MKNKSRRYFENVVDSKKNFKVKSSTGFKWKDTHFEINHLHAFPVRSVRATLVVFFFYDSIIMAVFVQHWGPMFYRSLSFPMYVWSSL